MANRKPSLTDQLLIIQGKIRSLPLPGKFKAILMEDINHAIINLKQNLSAVLDSLSVIIGELHSRQHVSQCQSPDFGPLLADLHQSQQAILTMISQGWIPEEGGPFGTIRYTEHTVATGPNGLAGNIEDTGYTDAFGPFGPTGHDGATGATGPSGAAGNIGATGATGPSALDPHLSCETDSVLTCGQFSPGMLRTVATDREGNIVTIPAATKHSQLGQLFGVSNDTTSVPVGQPLWLQLTNPSNSGRVLHIQRVIGGINEGACEINLYQNAPPLANSNTVPITRRNWGSTNTSSAVVTISANSGPVFVGLLQNTFHTAGYFELEFGGELVIPSAATDQTFTLQIINVSPVTINADITIVWSETP